MRGISLIGIDGARFYHLLACTLIKEPGDQKIFDKVFQLYFKGKALKTSERKKEVSEDFTSENRAETADGRGLGPSGSGVPVEAVLQTVTSGSADNYRALVERAVNSMGRLHRNDLERIDELLQRAKVTLQWFMVLHRLEQLKERNLISEESWQSYMENMKQLEILLEQEIEKRLVEAFGEEGLVKVLANTNLREKNFYELREDQVEELRMRVRRLARRLATRRGRRRKLSSSGQVLLRQVLQESRKTAGIPVKLVRGKREVSKPELIILCDVSGSVARFSEFMLQLVYSIQSQFKKVRSFVFVDTLEEVTHLFSTLKIEEALGQISRGMRCSQSGYSDFGRVFQEFAENYLAAVTHTTTLIILGDAKNNWRPPRTEFLAEIASKARRVIWLNPRPKETWNQEDGLMDIYAPYCDKVLECRNLRQLERVASDIF
ncbi:VWA domain-containing protein [Calderihabitans maritimus]|uniref:VWA containing CoxE family protein n=1 Tax=Calderihabitans maritimus TaxID=1246530 RepID=A0A1Z5HPZ0_9FIRM|nr:VWA domain-containing protein [Calderihabitans maritimus]GAW91508.1 hypothetical protein CoxE-like protein [Calderihabitans maritimus]